MTHLVKHVVLVLIESSKTIFHGILHGCFKERSVLKFSMISWWICKIGWWNNLYSFWLRSFILKCPPWEINYPPLSIIIHVFLPLSTDIELSLDNENSLVPKRPKSCKPSWYHNILWRQLFVTSNAPYFLNIQVSPCLFTAKGSKIEIQEIKFLFSARKTWKMLWKQTSLIQQGIPCPRSLLTHSKECVVVSINICPWQKPMQLCNKVNI